MDHQDARARAETISFRHLKLFHAIGEVGSVRRAASLCALSQPAVAQSLARLEQLIGLTLVDRSAGGSTLNGYGRILHDRTIRFFSQGEATLVDLGFCIDAAAARLMLNRITRCQLRALGAIADLGATAAAAQRLGISQQAVQKSLKELEGNVRRTLCHRTSAGQIVTAPGRELARRMKLAQQEIEWGIEEILTQHSGAKTHISIGAKHFGGSMVLTSVLEPLLQLQPNADVQITHGSARDMLAKLRAGEVEVVVGLLPRSRPADLVSEAVARTPYHVVARKGHPLLGRDRPTLRDLRGYDWVVGAPDTRRRTCFETLFRDTAEPPSVATSSLTIIRHLLANSDRLTLLTSYELANEGGGLETIPFDPLAHVPEMGVTRRANWLPTKLHADFVRLVHEHMATALSGAASPATRQ